MHLIEKLPFYIGINEVESRLSRIIDKNGERGFEAKGPIIKSYGNEVARIAKVEGFVESRKSKIVECEE